MLCFLVVYRELSHEWLDFSKYTHQPLGECVYKEKPNQITNLSYATKMKKPPTSQTNSKKVTFNTTHNGLNDR